MTTKRIYNLQLQSIQTGVSIRDAGGVCYVAAAAGNDKVTLTDPDNDFAALTNPIALSNGRIRFAVEKTVLSVDLYIQAPGGQFIVVKAAEAGAQPEIYVDLNQVQQAYVIPFSITDTTAATETDTGFNLPKDAAILPTGVGIKVDVLEATETIDVGILSGEAGGDADGFMSLVSVAALGFVTAAAVVTVGGTENFFASTTLGAMLSENFLAGLNVATDVGTNNPISHVGDGTAESISYTLTAGTALAKGKIVLPVLLANI